MLSFGLLEAIVEINGESLIDEESATRRTRLADVRQREVAGASLDIPGRAGNRVRISRPWQASTTVAFFKSIVPLFVFVEKFLRFLFPFLLFGIFSSKGTG